MANTARVNNPVAELAELLTSKNISLIMDRAFIAVF